MPFNQHHTDTSTAESNFDYIITGAGCAGLSLLMHMMQNPFFNSKQVLVIDESEKNKNDRTWCFWETQAGLFEPIIHHQWNQINFYSGEFSSQFSIAPYSYKMIKGIDFYNYVFEHASKHSNIQFYKGKVDALGNEGDKAIVISGERKFSAQYVFNSILFEDISKYPLKEGGFYYLLQHFKGWLIETASPFFDEQVATFMDFRVSQHNGTTFAYMLPVSPNRALVEYTLFSPSLLSANEYDEALKDYIGNFLHLTDYTVKEEEFGVIPMTSYPFSRGEGNIINIGTAGGKTKSSSGYTFRFIQKHSLEIIHALLENKTPHIKKTLSQKRFDLYDSTLLQILSKQKSAGDKIFSDLFKSNQPQTVLRFLDNETSLAEELKIMSSVSSAVFLPAAFKEIFKGV